MFQSGQSGQSWGQRISEQELRAISNVERAYSNIQTERLARYASKAEEIRHWSESHVLQLNNASAPKAQDQMADIYV